MAVLTKAVGVPVFLLLQLPYTQEASSASFRHGTREGEGQPSLEGVGALMELLELKAQAVKSCSHYFIHPAGELCMNMYVSKAEVITYARFHHA